MSATVPAALNPEQLGGTRWPQLWLGVVCMILIANLQYAWTLFVSPMHKAHGWALADIQTAFVIFVALETWLTPVEGWFVDRLGARRGPPIMIAAGGVLVAAGWILNAYATSLGALYGGATLSGIGAGAVYATCVGNAVKWFPDKRGLAVGLTAAGFGAGAALTVIPIRTLIDSAGYAQAFFWVGLIQGAVLLLVAPLMRAPLPAEIAVLPRAPMRQSRTSTSPMRMLASPVFWLLYVMFTLISASGLMLTAQVAPIAKDFGLASTNLFWGASVLSTALVVDSVMNGLARPFFGWVSDRLGREITMAIAFTLGAASYALLPIFGHSPWGFVICAGLAFFTFGEIFSLFPSTATDLFGTRYATTNASLLYTAKGTSVLLIQWANMSLGSAGNWKMVFTASAVANIVVVLAALLILRPVRAARLRAEQARDAIAEDGLSYARPTPTEPISEPEAISTMPQTLSHPDTIAALLSHGAADAPAIGAPGRASMTYAQLRALSAETGRQLAQFGIGRGDRVAIVLANGPEMATAFITIATHATTAPLNPAYRQDEFNFYLSDLGARAIVIAEGVATPAREVAAGLGIRILDLACDAEGPAGNFTLHGEPADPVSQDTAGPGDLALVLHTSGTTSRPKIVPLTQANVTASAANIARSLALGPDDLCLNIMPLFHIHGLIAATLASLSAGAAVCCTPGFNAFRFFAWLEETKASWYTAVPTMHQAILQLAPRNAEIIAGARLRFIRSSSASLPAPVMQAVEAAFGIPVIEAYGMTEASHQMACNPLPPAARYPGSVGIAAGPEIGVMDEAGALLDAGALGEIVIRGPNVTAGYENNPQANEDNFINGWFRTGDQGILDEHGYLRLTGRLKEQINRGGEKISPLEVDSVLLDHPAVAQCLTFAVPHDKLGEEVAAAIVLHEGASATDHDLRDFAATRLAPFKVPRKVVFLDEIPKGATGKLQRIGLAQKLGLA